MNYFKQFKTETEEALKRYKPDDILTKEDIEGLPGPVKKYIEYTGAIGKPKLHNIKLVFKGQIRMGAGKLWMNFKSVQYNFFDEPERIFYIKSGMFGLPVSGLHLYKNKKATMQINAACFFRVADGKGFEMDKGETVTVFNDMCCMAPASLIDKKIKWEEIDNSKVKGIFKNGDLEISSILYFNETGQLIDFSSVDRYESADGKSYKALKWTTPLSGYKEINGINIPTYGETHWHPKTGEFAYGKFNLQEVVYNSTTFE